MSPMKLYFDVRDVCRAPRLALSGKKILIFLLGLLSGWVAYWVLTNIALALAGYSFATVWEKFGLYPCLYATGCGPWYAQLVYWIGIIIWFLTINLACTAVARVTYKQLKGDEFYSSGDAWKYVKKHWHPVVFGSFSIIVIIVLFLFMAAVFSLFGKIPYVGEFLFALPYLFYFFGAVFTVYTAVVLITSFIYTPAIVGAYEEDTMGTVFQSYSLTWSQPWRILLYNLILLPLGYLSVYIFGLFWYGGYKLINIVFGAEWFMGMGAKLTNIVGYASQIVFPSFCSGGCSGCGGCGLCCLFPAAAGDIPVVQAIAGVIVAIFLFLLFASIVAYGLSILSVGETLMFVIYKKKSDDDNLLERKDEEELEAEEEEKEEAEDDTGDDEPDADSVDSAAAEPENS
ncbi:MAG: hypothetical protein ABIA75_10370 [Candidatus Neomarinimicrobiota bacterium]